MEGAQPGAGTAADDGSGVGPTEHHGDDPKVVAFLDHVRRAAGDAAATRVVQEARRRVAGECPDDGEQWTRFFWFAALLAAAETETGHPDVAGTFGEMYFTYSGTMPLAGLLRSLGDPADALAFVADLAISQDLATELACEQVARRCAVVSLHIRRPAKPEMSLCRFMRGVISAVPTVFGLAPATVVELQCQVAGAHRCVYDVAWDETEQAPDVRHSTSGGLASDNPMVPPELATVVPDSALRAWVEAVVTGARRHEAAIESLLQLAVGVAHARDTKSVAGQLARWMVEFGGCRRVVVLLWDADGDRLVEVARHGPVALARPVACPAVIASRRLVENLAARRRPLSLAGYGVEPILDDLIRLLGFADGVLVPILARSTCAGVVAVDQVVLGGFDRLGGLDGLGDHPTVSSGRWGPKVDPAADPDAAPGWCWGADPSPGGVRGFGAGELALGAARMAGAALARLSLVEELRRRSLHDPGTGLPNARLLRSQIDQALAGARRQGRHACLLYLDLDRFKEVNDGFGREVGDRVLQVLADRLRREVRGADVVARIGGDEFAVLLGSTPGMDEAAMVAGRVRRACTDPVRLGDSTVTVSVSMGVALAMAEDRADDLLGRASHELRRAKAHGPGHIRGVA